MRWFTAIFLLNHPLDAEVASQVRAIPGALAIENDAGSRIVCCGDSVSVISRLLEAHGIQWRPAHQGTPGHVLAPLDVPNIRPETRDATFPYQWDGLAHLLRLRGGAITWDCGTGKTRVGVLWLATKADRKTVIVARTPAIVQWRSAILGLTTFPSSHLHIVEGQVGYRVEPSPPPEGEVWVRRVDKPAQELVAILLEAGVKRGQLQGAMDVLFEIPDTWAPKVEYAVHTRSAHYKRHVTLGIIEEETRTDAQWKPWRVISLDRPRRVVSTWDGTEPLICLDPMVRMAWNEAAAAPIPSADKIRAQILLARTGGMSVERILATAAASTPPIPPGEVMDILARACADADCTARQIDLGCGPEPRVVLVSWSILESRVQALQMWGPDTVIFDESQHAKSSKIWDVTNLDGGGVSFRYKDSMSGAAAALSTTRTVREVALLSATLLIDRARDLWSQMRLLDDRMPGRKYNSFAYRYCAAYDTGQWLDDRGSSNEEELRERLRTLSHHVDASVAFAHLPPLVVEVTIIPSKDLVFQPTSKATMRTIKAAGHLAILHYELLQAAEAKTPYVLQAALAALEDGDQVAIFTERPIHAQHLAEALRGMTKHPVYLSQDDSGDRQMLVQTFRGEPRGSAGPGVLIGTLKSWGDSIDGLQGTPHVFVCMLPWNLSLVQFLGRFRRHGGGTRGSVIHILVAEGTRDLRMVEVVVPKLRAAATITDSAPAGELATALTAGQQVRDSEMLSALFDMMGDNDDIRWTDIDDE